MHRNHKKQGWDLNLCDPTPVPAPRDTIATLLLPFLTLIGPFVDVTLDEGLPFFPLKSLESVLQGISTPGNN